MKRHLSIFMLFIRSTFYRVLVVLGLLAVTETGLVYVTLERFLAESAQGAEKNYALSELIKEAGLIWVFVIAFVLITVILCMFGCDFRGKLEYTLQRLGVSPVKIFFWQAACNALTYVIFWMVQVYLVFGFGMYYMKAADPSWVTNQTLFLEFYRSRFLFSIFPMEDVGIWVTNVCLVLCLGIVTARVPHAQRRGKPSVGFFAVMLIVGTLFWQGWGLFENAAVALALLLIVTGMTLAFVGLTEPGLDEE